LFRHILDVAAIGKSSVTELMQETLRDSQTCQDLFWWWGWPFWTLMCN